MTEAKPERMLSCPRCGSERVVPDVKLEQHGPRYSCVLTAVVAEKPDALIFKDRAMSDLVADVCADCGHVEWRAKGAEALYRAWLKSKE